MWSYLKKLSQWLFGDPLPPERRREEEAWCQAGLLKEHRINLLRLGAFLELVLIEKKVKCEYNPRQRRAILSIGGVGIAYIAAEHFFVEGKSRKVITVQYTHPLEQDHYCWFQLAFLGRQVRYLPLQAVPLLEYKPELPRGH